MDINFYTLECGSLWNFHCRNGFKIVKLKYGIENFEKSSRKIYQRNRKGSFCCRRKNIIMSFNLRCKKREIFV